MKREEISQIMANLSDGKLVLRKKSEPASCCGAMARPAVHKSIVFIISSCIAICTIVCTQKKHYIVLHGLGHDKKYSPYPFFLLFLNEFWRQTRTIKLFVFEINT
jgi:hypothetical protein